jgi:hypothetical protein
LGGAGEGGVEVEARDGAAEARGFGAVARGLGVAERSATAAGTDEGEDDGGVARGSNDTSGAA